MEQLNIEGKRSGEGFVAHRARLVDALVRANAERINIGDLTIGRKGFLGFLKAMGGSNVIKVVPSNGGASGTQTAVKRLKVVCGGLTSYLDSGEWVGEKTPVSYADLRVSPRNVVKPNLGAGELAATIARVIPFTAKDKSRPVLACVNIEAGEGKITFVCADGFTLAVDTLDYEDSEGVAVIQANELKSALTAIRRASRAKLTIGDADEGKSGKSLIVETELIRYKWNSADYNFPNWRKLLPDGGECRAHFDTTELLKAVRTLEALNQEKTYLVDLTIGDGKIKVATVDSDGDAEIPADTEGEPIEVRLDGNYLEKVCQSFAGMVDLDLISPDKALNFSNNGFRVVVMPVLKEAKKAEAPAPAEAKVRKPKRKAQKTAEPAPEAEITAESEAEPTEAEPAAVA